MNLSHLSKRVLWDPQSLSPPLKFTRRFYMARSNRLCSIVFYNRLAKYKQWSRFKYCIIDNYMQKMPNWKIILYFKSYFKCQFQYIRYHFLIKSEYIQNGEEFLRLKFKIFIFKHFKKKSGNLDVCYSKLAPSGTSFSENLLRKWWVL